MKLVVFPGGGSPANAAYKKVYELIEKNARDFGFDSVVGPLMWPGHSGSSGGDPGTRLTLPGAIDRACEVVKKLDNEGDEYTILGRSFGTYVASKLGLFRRICG